MSRIEINFNMGKFSSLIVQMYYIIGTNVNVQLKEHQLKTYMKKCNTLEGSTPCAASGILQCTFRSPVLLSKTPSNVVYDNGSQVKILYNIM